MVKPRFTRLMAPLMLLAITVLILLVYRQLDRPVSKVVVSGELDAAERAQIREAVAAAESELADTGRIVLRASGTEPVIRVMVEGQDEKKVVSVAEKLAAVVAEAAG